MGHSRNIGISRRDRFVRFAASCDARFSVRYEES